MAWSKDLKDKIADEYEGSVFYKQLDIGPNVQKKIIDSLFRTKLAAYLASKPVWQDRADYHPAKVSNEDMAYVELLGQINGNLTPEQFNFAPKDAISIDNIDLEFITLKLNTPLPEQKELCEIIKEVGVRTQAKNRTHSCEVIPADVDAEGYFRIVVFPDKQTHAYISEVEYTVKQAKLLNWAQYAVINLPSGEALLDLQPLKQVLGESTN